MKKLFKLSFAIVLCASFFLSCKKDIKQDVIAEVPQSVIDKVHQLGFSTQNIAVHEDGFLVEGDIVITDRELNTVPESDFLRVGEVEQYRTNNLVSSRRSITVSISSQLPASYVGALNLALSRYNALGLRLSFQRVSSNADISIVRGNGSYLASAGFPSGGDPYDEIEVSSSAIGNQPQATVASILAHEIGHCIGFRHTDYMNRAYSCGGQVVNEGASTVGAVLVPGTPKGPDPNSWMLACIGSGVDRPFNDNDKTALNYLY